MTIRTLLIANRGQIARRVIRTARLMGLRTIAVYAEPDRLAPHVQEADVAVPLRASSAVEHYLDREAVLEAAAWQGADAVHPGGDFLARSPAFAKNVLDAGLVWVGPPPAAIRTVNDKLEAAARAERAGVPVLPTAVLSGDEGRGWDQAVQSIGYPLIVGLASRGGPPGQRVAAPGDLAAAVAAARHAARASSADQLVVAQPALDGARRIDVPVLADTHGGLVHLGAHDCSIRRAGRALVAETPAPALPPDQRAELAEAARRLARALDYVGVGSVELLVAGDHHWFVGMHPALSSTHPLTEEVTGLDLVRLQLEVAGGAPLPLTQAEVSPSGCAVAASLSAEEPAAGWAHATGRLHRWRRGPTPGVRYDDAVTSGATITSSYDPLLSTLIAGAATRSEAAARLVRALRELHVHGVTSNRDYLVDVLSDAAFLAGEVTTEFVDQHPAVPDDAEPTRRERQWQRFNAVLGPHLAAAALADPSRHATRCPAWPFVPTGWRNVGGSVRELRPGETTWTVIPTHSGFASQTTSFEHAGERWDVSYNRVQRDHPLAVARRTDAVRTPSELFNVSIAGPSGNTTTIVELIALDEEVTLVHFGRRGHRCTVNVVGNCYYVNSALGQTELVVLPRFTETARLPQTGGAGNAAGGAPAPVAGRVVAVDVHPGTRVTAGATLVVLASGDEEHRVQAMVTGTVVDVLVSPGDAVDAHQLLVRMEESSE